MSYSMTMEDLFRMAVISDASDLHLISGAPPHIRIHGKLVALDMPILTSYDLEDLIYPILTDAQIETLKRNRELDFAHIIPSLAQFRGNIMYERDSLAVVFRIIPLIVPSVSELGLPKQVEELCNVKDGLILVTGPSGSGKSTTLAAIIDKINTEQKRNIITIEDPIEFVHIHKNSIIRQREVGKDTYSFEQALRYALRHDPDIILIGEMRDSKSISAALTAAETGHLVFSTLHTSTAPATIGRIIDVFHRERQEQIRPQLANTIRAVISQRLIPDAKGEGRVAAVELMLSIPSIKNIIREGREHQLYSTIQTHTQMGMQTMDYALADLYLQGKILREDAFANCIDSKELERIIRARGDFFQI